MNPRADRIILWIWILLCAGIIGSALVMLLLSCAPAVKQQPKLMLGPMDPASEYDLRYHTEPITEENWNEATRFRIAAPGPVGSLETTTVTGLTPCTTYYFALKTADEVPNWSEIGNVASGMTDSGWRVVDDLLTLPSDREYPLTIWLCDMTPGYWQIRRGTNAPQYRFTLAGTRTLVFVAPSPGTYRVVRIKRGMPVEREE